MGKCVVCLKTSNSCNQSHDNDVYCCATQERSHHVSLLLLLFFLGLRISICFFSHVIFLLFYRCVMWSAFICFISRHAQCGIVLFSDCVYCAGFCNQENQNRRLQFVRYFSLQSLGCVDFCVAPSPRRNILCDKKMWEKMKNCGICLKPIVIH